MRDYQRQFIELSLHYEALRFGNFTLKSGRISPYFFNAGQFQTGKALADIGKCYAAALMESGLPFDMLFGPAYKGIPLVSAIVIALSEHYDCDVPYCFNRKEAKTHGEGGQLVGAPLRGDVVIADDVITAGTAIGEVMQLFKSYPEATPAAVIIGLDRQERGENQRSAAQEVSLRYQVPVLSVINLDDLMNYITSNDRHHETLAQIRDYRDQYGC